MSIETTSRPNGHGHDNAAPRMAEAQCPYCGQSVSRKEFREIQARMRDEERARVAEVERGLQEKFARETAKAEAAKKAEIETAKRDATAAADQQVKALRASLETTIAERMAAQQENHEKVVNAAVLSERAKHIGEKLALEGQVDEMKRRLQSLTAHQRGEPAEVDLYEALAAAFPDDRVSRVAKGARGPDVIVEIFDRGAVVGKVVLDSKNHARWSNRFTSKLRSDQIAEGADFAILSSSVFPAGAQQLHLQDNVIVASPQRVVVLVHLLRRQIVQNHRHKLSVEARSEKADRLYDFIMSPACSDLLDRIVKIALDMAALDRTETVAHEKTWNRRSELIRAIQAAHSDLTGQIDAIISGDLALEIGCE